MMRRSVWCLALGLLFVGLLTFTWPRIEIEPLATQDTSSGWSIPFKITNRGHLQLRDITTACTLYRARWGVDTVANAPLVPHQPPRLLKPGAAMTTQLAGDGPIRELEIGITVSFRDALWWFSRQRTFYFLFFALRSADGSIRLVSVPTR
jgi:hypothetical protein